jgi:Spy/CpxP family protein refolding chaperone
VGIRDWGLGSVRISPLRTSGIAWIGAGAIAVLCAIAPVAARQRPPAPPAAEAGVSPGEIQRMFDAYALLQAQEQLKIGDDQYAQFLSRFKALQDARRRAMQERVRQVQALRKLVNDPQSDENQIKEQLKTLQDVEARAIADVKKASDAVDQVLDIRQQAKFRVFEENMERRKLELLARARLANRAGKQQ